MKYKKSVLIILLIQITEVLGFSLILPFLPFYAKEMGANPLTIGLIITSFSLFQFISAPIMGKLSDFYGRKPLLIISQISTFLSFIILGFANKIWLLFLSRIMDGLLGANNSIAQAYWSDISTKEERAKAFGLSGVAFGIGFLIGPAIGGVLSQINFAIPAFLAAAISFITILLTIFLLPETVKKKKLTNFKVTIINIQDFKENFSNPKVSNKLWQFFSYISAQLLFTSSFSIFADKKFAVTPQDVGYILAFIGLTSIILRGFLIQKLINFFGENKLKVIGVALFIVGLVGSALVTQWWMFIFILILFSIGSGLSRPLMMSDISKNVDQNQQGEIMGFTNSLMSIAQIFTPLIGGYLLNILSPNSLPLLSAIFMIMGLMMMIRDIKMSKKLAS
jgi:MFS family permease